jgi:hypothetical protein
MIGLAVWLFAAGCVCLVSVLVRGLFKNEQHQFLANGLILIVTGIVLFLAGKGVIGL